MEIVYLVIGIVVGGLIGWLISKLLSKQDKGLDNLEKEIQNLRQDQIRLQERIESLKREKELIVQESINNKSELQQELSHERNKSIESQKRTVELAEKNQNLIEKLEVQKSELQEMQKKFTTEFENIANKILEDKSKRFTEQNRVNIDSILNPLKEKIKDFEEKVDKAYKIENAERVTLKTEIKNLVDLNKQISEEANNLAQALKGDNKMQGNWGEVILEKVLERSGLVKDQEYRTQYSATNEDGKRIQPDVVIMLPENKHIIIDAKVSLVAYEKWINCEDTSEKEKYGKMHLESVRGHIKLLSEKNYVLANEINSPDFVLLFIPIEASFSAAIQADNDLFAFAWDRKIVIVSPSTLLATLRTIASIWKQEYQSRNAIEIARQGGAMYDKFVGFVEDLVAVGNKMKDSQKAYEAAMNKLVTGTGNLVKRTEDLKKLGAKASKNLPVNIVERADPGNIEIPEDIPEGD